MMLDRSVGSNNYLMQSLYTISRANPLKIPSTGAASPRFLSLDTSAFSRPPLKSARKPTRHQCPHHAHPWSSFKPIVPTGSLYAVGHYP